MIVPPPPSPVMSTPVNHAPGSETLAPEDYAGDLPVAEYDHCRGKAAQAPRFPSPRKPPARKLEDLLRNVSLEDNEDTQSTQGALAAMDAAEELIAQKAVADDDYRQQVSELPLLKPGQKVAYTDIDMGFRVRDGYKVCYDIDSVVIDEKRDTLYDKSKIWVFVTKWPAGFSWMYWTDATFGDEQLTLGQCAIRFGMATFSKPGSFQTKEVFLDSRMTGENSFVVAIVLDGKDQVMSRQKENNADVYRVWRSEVTNSIQQTIQLRELMNIRQRSTHVRWWEM